LFVGGLGADRNSLGDAQATKTAKWQKHLPKNPLDFVRWVVRIEVRGRYVSYLGICAVGAFCEVKTKTLIQSKRQSTPVGE
jgi:hypothetical protein